MEAFPDVLSVYVSCVWRNRSLGFLHEGASATVPRGPLFLFWGVTQAVIANQTHKCVYVHTCGIDSRKQLATHFQGKRVS